MELSLAPQSEKLHEARSVKRVHLADAAAIAALLEAAGAEVLLLIDPTREEVLTHALHHIQK